MSVVRTEQEQEQASYKTRKNPHKEKKGGEGVAANEKHKRTAAIVHRVVVVGKRSKIDR